MPRKKSGDTAKWRDAWAKMQRAREWAERSRSIPRERLDRERRKAVKETYPGVRMGAVKFVETNRYGQDVYSFQSYLLLGRRSVRIRVRFVFDDRLVPRIGASKINGLHFRDFVLGKSGRLYPDEMVAEELRGIFFRKLGFGETRKPH